MPRVFHIIILVCGMIRSFIRGNKEKKSLDILVRVANDGVGDSVILLWLRLLGRKQDVKECLW